MDKPVVTEVINFLHELDLLEAHLEEHQHFMDRIIVVESEVTYSGMTKPLFFGENKERFARFNVEHEVVPLDKFTPIPGNYPESEKKKWFDARRNNREAQQNYIFNKYKVDADYLCNTDADEIWSRDKWHYLYDMLKEEYCYIAPKTRRFMHFVDRVGSTQAPWRVTKTTQHTHGS